MSKLEVGWEEDDVNFYILNFDFSLIERLKGEGEDEGEEEANEKQQ